MRLIHRFAVLALLAASIMGAEPHTVMDSANNSRARIADILCSASARTSEVVNAVNAEVSHWGLPALDATTFGLFAEPKGAHYVAGTAGSHTLTSVGNPWTAADVGKLIDIAGAKADHTTLRTTISGYTDAGTITLTDALGSDLVPSTSSAAGLAIWGKQIGITLTTTPKVSADGKNALYAGASLDLSSLSGANVTATGGTVARSISNRAADELHPEDFGAIGNGVADDTAAVNACASAAGDYGAWACRSGAVYAVTGTVVLGKYQHVSGNGAKILATSSAINPIVQLHQASQELFVGGEAAVRNLRIVGVSGDAGSNVGIDVDSAAATLQNVTVTTCKVGIELGSSQFVRLFGCKAFGNGVGFHIESSPTGGGGNSSSFYDCVAGQNKVGLIVQGNSTFTVGTDCFRNFTSNQNEIAAFGLFYVSDNLNFDGIANEANATGGDASYSYVGRYSTVVVKKASIYARNAAFRVIGPLEEAAPLYSLRLENASTATLSSYFSNGDVSVDATSAIIRAGSMKVNSQYGAASGKCEFADRELMKRANIIRTGTSLPNLFGTISSGNTSKNGGGSVAYSTDALIGAVANVTFGAAAGNQDGNALRIFLDRNGTDDYIVAMTLKSTTDTTLSLHWYGFNGEQTPFTLKAGEYTRIVRKFHARTGGVSAFMALFPIGTDAPVVSVGAVQVSGGQGTLFLDTCGAVTDGYYNGN